MIRELLNAGFVKALRGGAALAGHIWRAGHILARMDHDDICGRERRQYQAVKFPAPCGQGSMAHPLEQISSIVPKAVAMTPAIVDNIKTRTMKAQRIFTAMGFEPAAQLANQSETARENVSTHPRSSRFPTAAQSLLHLSAEWDGAHAG